MSETVRMDARLDLAISTLEPLKLERVGRLQAEELEMVRQTLNDSPQPQASLTLGLLNLNPSLRPSRV